MQLGTVVKSARRRFGVIGERGRSSVIRLVGNISKSITVNTRLLRAGRAKKILTEMRELPRGRMHVHLFHFVRIQLFFDLLSQQRSQTVARGRFRSPVVNVGGPRRVNRQTCGESDPATSAAWSRCRPDGLQLAQVSQSRCRGVQSWVAVRQRRGVGERNGRRS